MILYPAIDLLDGRVVRLLKGDYEKVTVYAEDPVAMALKLKAEGAWRIHVVDLNAARDGGRQNLGIIAAIAEKTGLFVQNGGGIRSMEALKARFEAGVSRAVLGTAAAENPEFLREALRLYGEKIAVGMDCLGEEVMTRGWTEGGGIRRKDFVRELETLGVKTIIYTDISRDGALTGPAFDGTAELVKLSSADIILSGGVSGEEDLAKASKIGVAGAIIGRAYYEGKIDLKRSVERYQKGEE